MAPSMEKLVRAQIEQMQRQNIFNEKKKQKWKIEMISNYRIG